MFSISELLSRPYPGDITLDEAVALMRATPELRAVLDLAKDEEAVRIRFVWKRDGEEPREVHLHRTLAFWKAPPDGWTAGIDISDSGGGSPVTARPKELA